MLRASSCWLRLAPNCRQAQENVRGSRGLQPVGTMPRSAASASGRVDGIPAALPSEVIPGYYQIVQTDGYVLIFTEWMHDARVIPHERHAWTTHDPEVAWRFDRTARRRHAGRGLPSTSATTATHSIPASGCTVVERFVACRCHDAAISRHRGRSRHVGDRMDRRVAVHRTDARMVRRRLSRGQLRDRKRF